MNKEKAEVLVLLDGELYRLEVDFVSLVPVNFLINVFSVNTGKLLKEKLDPLEALQAISALSGVSLAEKRKGEHMEYAWPGSLHG
ncbi:hypothetical protein HY227_01345 [Candidatus Wolfebacteria bacterium]|nr:hypothetical protein [Candidatus Wolfebacteria bacterium]